MNIRNSLPVLLISVLGITQLPGQDFSALIATCWANNQQLKAHDFQLRQAEAALKEAQGLYLPNLSFGTQYTLAAGGRAIDFPVGDLLNPVYSTLNQITGSQQFQSLENQSIQFLPNNFYDARFRVQQVLFNPDLAINRALKSAQIDLKQLEIKAYKRELSKEVMNAYFQWRQADQAISIFQEADTLLVEAARTTQSMLRNGIALPSALSRIESEQASLKAQQIDAAANEENAWAYLTYLLGTNEERVNIILDMPDLPDSMSNPSGAREELAQLDQAIAMQQLAFEKEDRFYQPRLGAQLDIGSQAFDFNWAPYALLGVSLTWNIYDGKQHRYRQEQAQAAVDARIQQKAFANDQIELQKKVAANNLRSAILQAKTFQPRIRATEKAYREVYRKYQEGTANYLELLDARTQITQARIANSLARFMAWSKWADYIYAAASYPID
ncbi:MAG: TolC family protein [Lewinellaceae bacterium]|nr:TolC family protein [Lewinellaceae bacterium]